MSKHNKEEINLEKGYEADVINFKGIIYFGAGLFGLIVITFVLMWILQYHVLLPQAEANDKSALHPMAMNEDEKLPPEPRLQSAPGFGLDTKSGRINLELREPQAEWREIQKQNKDIWENGEKEGNTVIALPMKEAEEKLLKDGSIKFKTGAEGEKALQDAKTFISGSSAGRLASETRR